MSSAIDPELVTVAFLKPLAAAPVAALAMAPATSILPQHIVEVLDVATPSDAPHGVMWEIDFQITTIARTAGAAFGLAGDLQDALLDAAESDPATVAAGLVITSAEVTEHPLRTSTNESASTVVALYSLTAATPTL